MTHRYRPTATEMRDGYSVAYGDLGDLMLIGALFSYLTEDQKESVYRTALQKVREDMEKIEKTGDKIPAPKPASAHTALQ